MCVHMGWVRIVVLLYAMSPRATWPLFGVWKKRGEESCCSPGICPSYLSTICCCHVSPSFNRCWLPHCLSLVWKKKWGREVTHRNWCGQRRHVSSLSGQHGTPVDAPGCVHSKQCASMSRWRHVATLSSLNPRKRGLKAGIQQRHAASRS